MTSIYFSEHQLLIAGGRSNTAESWTVMDADRFMLGNEVTDLPGFKNAVLRTFKEKGFSGRNAVLVLNSNQVITRLMQIPTRDEEHMLEYISNEFSDVERAETPVFGYTVLTEDKKTKLSHVIAYLADRSLVKKYQLLFADCNIELSCICPSLACNLLALEAEKLKGSAVVEIMEPRGLTNLLLVDGNYAYSGFGRLQNAHGSPELGVEVARAVSNIVQFSQAQHLDDEVRQVLLAGFPDSDRQFTTDAINAMLPGMQTKEMTALKAKPYVECFPAAAGLHEVQRTENFRLMLEEKQKKKKIGTVGKLVILFTSLIMVLSAVTGVQLYLRKQQRELLEEINAYNNSQEVARQIDYGDTLDNVSLEMRNRVNAEKAAKGILESYPIPDSSVNECLNRCAEGLAKVEVIQYSGTSGELTISASSAQVDQIHTFVELLRKESVFTVQEYSGYEYLSEKQIWSISIVLVLNSNAGR